jgi:DNA-binding response OmpR family regulator
LPNNPPQPLALVAYQQLLPGSQVANRLVEIGYRVQMVPDVAVLPATALREMPLVVLVDLRWTQGEVLATITELRKTPGTQHIPILAFTTLSDETANAAARTAGATLVAKDDALLAQLPQLLDRVLAVD